MSLLSVKKCVLGRTALLPISMPLPASKEGMDHNQIQALGHFIPLVHNFPLHAGTGQPGIATPPSESWQCLGRGQALSVC